MKKYIDYVRIGIKEHMVYRSAIAANFFSKIIYLYLQICIWSALFASSSMKNPEMSKESTINYVITATIMSTFIECNVIERINAWIQSGNIVMELIRPVDFKKMLFSRHIGDTIAKVIFYCIPLTLLVFFISPTSLFCGKQIILGLFSAFLAYCIQFLYSLIIGLLAFWLIVTWPINMLLGAIYKLLSGAWIPVAMFPDCLYIINLFLPFRAIYAIPVSILTKHMEMKAINISMATQFFWTVVLYFIAEMVWIIGRKKLIVQGG